MFLTNLKADSGDRSPWGNFWFEPVPLRGGSANVTGDAALQLTAVYACVRNASEDTATLPFSMNKVGKDGKKTKLTNHWLYRLFAKRPNSFQNPLEFREMMQGHIELRGNAFAEIYANGKGEVTDLVPIHPDRVTIEMLSDINWRYVVKRQDGTEYRLSRADMFHIKGMSSNGVVGYNPIQLARKAIATGLAAQDYGMRFFENDAKPGGWIEHPNQFPTDEKRNQWREQWQAMQGGKNKHKTAVLEFGMKYHELTVSNDDAQFIETKKYSVADIARMWRMPLHMIGDLDRSTNNNIEQQSLEYVIYSIRPRLIRWEEAIKSSFLDVDDDSITLEFSVLALLRGDLKSRSAYIHSMVLDGVLTRNEAREMEGRDPLDGLDEPLRPLNMIEESAAEEEDEEVESGEALPSNANPNDPPAQPGKSDARLVALASAAAERVARKEAEMVSRALKGSPESLIDAYSKLTPFIAGAIGISAKAAQAYCVEQIELAQHAGNMELDHFAEIARCKLERLAIQGN